MPCSAKMDGREDSEEVVRHVASPFDLSQTLLVGGGLLVPCSLPGLPVLKQRMQMVTGCLARVGSFSQCASPNKTMIHLYIVNQFSSVQFSPSVVSDSLRPCELQHARPPCPSPASRSSLRLTHRVSDAI